MRKLYIIIFEILNFFDFRYRLRPLANIFDIVKLACLKKCGVKIGKNSIIGHNTIIESNVSIGTKSRTHSN